MQGKGFSPRLSILALVVVLIFGSLGGLTWARDAFDADYEDCPAVTRLGAVDGLAIDRTDEEDEIRISWDVLDSASLSRLGPNGYRARLTVIVDQGVGEDARNVALGDTRLVVDKIDFAKDLTVSVAVTLGNYVISDIAETDFTSGLPAPRFSTDIRVSANEVSGTFASLTGVDFSDTLVDVGHKAEISADIEEIELLLKFVGADATVRTEYNNAKSAAPQIGTTYDDVISSLDASVGEGEDVTGEERAAARRKGYERVIKSDNTPAEDSDGELRDLGTFYYLGFNDLFDNWYVRTGAAVQRPRSPKFRVGLQHGASGVDAGDADFENYRIVIEDSDGDLLGYQAETVSASGTYEKNKIVFATLSDTFLTAATWRDSSTTDFSNIRLSNNVTGNSAVSPYFGKIKIGDRPDSLRKDLAYGNVGLVDASRSAFPLHGVLYADPPVEYFDFPSDIFESDGSYTIKAWAEDGDGSRISPQASIVLGAQERESASGSDAGVGSYSSSGIRSFDNTGTNTLTVYGFSIQDE